MCRKSITLDEKSERRLEFIKYHGEFTTDSQAIRAALSHLQQNMTRHLRGCELVYREEGKAERFIDCCIPTEDMDDFSIMPSGESEPETPKEISAQDAPVLAREPA